MADTVLGTLRTMADLGVATFPVRPRDKRPAITKWQECEVDCSDDAIRYYESHPDSNIAILCGKASGNLFVIDIDTHDADGFEYLRKWESEHGELPDTVMAKTGSYGTHMLYRSDKPVKTGANGDLGIDVRGEGGFIVAPPSIHPNGNAYTWENDPEDYEIAMADDNVMAFLESIQKGSSDKKPTNAKFYLPDKIMRGERDDTLFRYACSMQSAGYDDNDISLLVHAANDARCHPPLSEREVDAKVAQALKYEKGKSIDVSKAISRSEKRASLMLTSKGETRQTIDNCIRVLSDDSALSGRFAYNTMSYTKMALDPLPWTCGADGWRNVRDSDYAELAAWMEVNYGLNSKQKATDAVLAICERSRINPVEEWLKSLEWDGTERMRYALEVCIGCAGNEYTRAVSSLIFLGGVARAVKGGTKFDYMAVLVGDQGSGKSTFVSKLAVNPEWYLDNLGSFDGDSAIEKIRGKWIVEVAELAAFKSRAGIEQIKAFVTTKSDSIRPKYARETEDRPRRCVFIGTTNDESFLVDATGNRRYLPVRVMQRNPEFSVFTDLCDEFIIQCWAEAYAKNADGSVPLVMPRSIEESAQKAQSEFTEEDPRIGVIGAWLDNIRMNPTLNDKRVCAIQIAVEALEIEKKNVVGNRRIINEIHAIMQNCFCGEWEKMDYPARTNDYGNQRCYVPCSQKSHEFGAVVVE